MNTRLRWWLARLGLLLGGLLAGVLLAEGLARVAQPDGGAQFLFNASDGEPEGLLLDHPQLLNVLQPGFSGTVVGPGRRIPIRINSLGFRGPEPGEKGGFRWLAVGDSFTFAAQVPEERSFVGLLAGRLGLEVFNGGVEGDSTWQATRRYLLLDDALQADGVLLVFFLGNDLADNQRLEAVVRNGPGPGGQPPAAGQRPHASGVARLLLSHSRLYAHWRVLVRRQRYQQGASHVQEGWRQELALFSVPGRATLQGMLPRTREALLELQRHCAERGDRLVVALAPPSFQVEPALVAPSFELVDLDPAQAALDAPRDALQGLLGQLGVRTCDLTPALRRAQQAGDATYLVYDGHWSADGHRVVAEALEDCLAE